MVKSKHTLLMQTTISALIHNLMNQQLEIDGRSYIIS